MSLFEKRAGAYMVVPFALRSRAHRDISSNQQSAERTAKKTEKPKKRKTEKPKNRKNELLEKFH
jgi:hypothetical protein